ncbi:hypothetical protein HJC23_007488 [Cyclotella cryptica]|uniref:FYVE-type domain-containing protein n=1 Tax=Cyclotella cryptica TaxID=29204 RepID=A0ABD3NKH7_9STRA|eukprot:CCRYP_020667-RA/>CCRYP_020667-RA protein AED:0.08 eAED:0.08 QI:0/-1/0/1/-1/1/1/0/547
MSNQQQPSTENNSLFAPTIVNLPPLPESQRSNDDNRSTPPTSPRRSSPWQPDPTALSCTSCHTPFDPLNRRHHCRLCGMVFCHSCSNTRSLIPPTDLVLRSDNNNNNNNGSRIHNRSAPLHSPHDPASPYDTSLEYRIHQSRQPQRTCHPCRARLAPLQDELRETNSNASRYNFVHASGGVRSLCNSPLAFTLGHEVRKAAYALANLLPREKQRRGGALIRLGVEEGEFTYPPREADPCRDNFDVDFTLRNVDGVHIPSKLLRKAKGIAIVTCAKGGLGFAGFEFGTGLVVARCCSSADAADNDDATFNKQRDNMDWSAPSAIGLAGFAWGALLGAQLSDHIFLLMTSEAVRLFSTQDATIQLGVDVGVAVGPVGRSAEADLAASRSNGTVAMAPIYTYSLSKGLYAGVSMDGRVVVTRPRVNEKFYGRAVTAEELLGGHVPRPPAAQPLYDAIRRCLVYGDGVGESSFSRSGGGGGSRGGMLSSESGHSAEKDNPNRTMVTPGGLFERWSHTTGLGMPVATPPSRTENPYNLAGRYDPTWQPNFSE